MPVGVTVLWQALRLPKGRLIQLTIALLQSKSLVALHTYVHCVSEPPEPPPAAEGDRAAAAAQQRYRLYRRLRPMLHGEHHLEEILWQERLGREVLDELLSAFEEHLITCVTFEAGHTPGSS